MDAMGVERSPRTVTSRVSAASCASCSSNSACEEVALAGVLDGGWGLLFDVFFDVFSDAPFGAFFELLGSLVLSSSRGASDKVLCSVLSCAAIVSGVCRGTVVDSVLDWAAAVAQ